MKTSNKFKIPAFGLSEGVHDFSFDDLELLFALFDSDTSGKLVGRVRADKSSLLIELQIHISGTVLLICDRTGKEFDFMIDVSERFVYNFGSENKELSENVLEIRLDTDYLDLSQFFYDLIMISIPMKKIHPDHQNDYLQEQPEGYLVYSDSISKAANPEHDGSDSEIDPRWAALQKLKNQQ